MLASTAVLTLGDPVAGWLTRDHPAAQVSCLRSANVQGQLLLASLFAATTLLTVTRLEIRAPDPDCAPGHSRTAHG